jgi:hypothetical protein
MRERRGPSNGGPAVRERRTGMFDAQELPATWEHAGGGSMRLIVLMLPVVAVVGALGWMVSTRLGGPAMPTGQVQVGGPDDSEGSAEGTGVPGGMSLLERSAYEKLQAAEEYAQKNPDDTAGQIERYEMVLARGTRFAETAKERIARLKAGKDIAAHTDRRPPQLICAVKTTDDRMLLVFDEPLDAGSATDPANYNGAQVATAKLSDDGRVVFLGTNGNADTIRITKISDRAAPANVAHELSAKVKEPEGQGVRWTLYMDYHGSRVPTDFASLSPERSGTAAEISLRPLSVRNNDHFAVRFEALLRVESTGTHEFKVRSDDGALLFINGRKIIDNDGSHPVSEKTAELHLDAGLHWLVLDYFQDRSDQEVSLQMRVPDGNMQPIGRFLRFPKD